jgi:hypothetical protein
VNRAPRYFSGYYIFGLWNIENCIVVLFVSYPPELKHQEDVLGAHNKIPLKRDFIMGT